MSSDDPPSGSFVALTWDGLHLLHLREVELKASLAAAKKSSNSHKRKAPLPPTAPTRSSGRTQSLKAQKTSHLTNLDDLPPLIDSQHSPLPPRVSNAPRLRKSNKVIAPSTLLSRHPLPFHLRPPTVPLHEIKGEVGLKDWVKEAVRVWDEMAEERRSRPGHHQSRFIVEEEAKETTKRENRSRNEARDKRRREERERAEKEAALRKAAEAAAAAVAQLQRKPVIVAPPPPVLPKEDSSLPSFASSPPLPSSDDLLRPCPAPFLSGVLRAFDFLHFFSQPLGFSVAPHSVHLSLFLSVLLTPPSPTENHLINTMMAALLRAVLRTRPPPSCG